MDGWIDGWIDRTYIITIDMFFQKVLSDLIWSSVNLGDELKVQCTI